MRPTLYVHLVAISVSTVLLSVALPSNPWGMWLALMTVTMPTLIYLIPGRVVRLRGYRSQPLQDEVNAIATLGRNYAIAFSPRDKLDYHLALTELHYSASREIERERPEYREWLGKDAALVFWLVNFGAARGEEVDMLDKLRDSGIRDFTRLDQYAEHLGLEDAMLAIREDIPLEYARVMYSA